MVGKEDLDLGKLGERFEVHNRSDRKAPTTVRWYNQSLEVFALWLAHEGMSTCLDNIGEEEVGDLSSTCREGGACGVMPPPTR
jgi:hypothetical protein